MEDMKVTPMTPSFALFNSHVNDADKKARAILACIAPDKLKRIKKLEKEGKGIMHILNVEPEAATVAFIWLVTALVNADRVEV